MTKNNNNELNWQPNGTYYLLNRFCVSQYVTHPAMAPPPPSTSIHGASHFIFILFFAARSRFDFRQFARKPYMLQPTQQIQPIILWNFEASRRSERETKKIRRINDVSEFHSWSMWNKYTTTCRPMKFCARTSLAAVVVVAIPWRVLSAVHSCVWWAVCVMCSVLSVMNVPAP